jgi:hypothetical protein
VHPVPVASLRRIAAAQAPANILSTRDVFFSRVMR